RLFSIPPGAPFLATLADSFLSGRLVPGFSAGADPLALAEATIYVPTRRAARELRNIFVEESGGRAAILPTIRPLGEFDEDAASFEPGGSDSLGSPPPIGAMHRLLLLAPLVQRWKAGLPAHVRARFDEEITVPTS